jgi:predicted amino acid racemase
MINALVRKSESIQVERMTKCRGRSKRTLVEVVKRMSIKEVVENRVLDRIEWWKRIHVVDFD